MLDLIDRMVAEIGKPKFAYEHAAFDDELFEKLVENEFAGMEYCMDTDDKERPRSPRERVGHCDAGKV